MSLTARQRAVIEFVDRFNASHGYGPTIREIGDGVGLSSTSSVAHQVKTLCVFGWLAVEEGKPRTLHVRRPGEVHPCPVCRGTGVGPRTEKETA